MLETNGAFTDTIPTTVFAGDGDDRLRGGAGAEDLVGGAGADEVAGGGGADDVLLGSGTDTAIWSIGDGSDVVEGQTGSDLLQIVGTPADEQLELTAAGSRLRAFFVGEAELLDVAGVETVAPRPGRGADTVSVNNLTGTGTSAVAVDLAVPGAASSDASADQVLVAGTPGVDTPVLSGAGGTALVTGLPAEVQVGGADRFSDRLLLDADSGNDQLTVATSVGGVLLGQVDGGEGSDTVTTNGSAGIDLPIVSAAGARVRVAAGGTFFEAVAETTVVNGLAGPDRLRVSGDVDAVTTVVLDGGDDNDILDGGDGSEVLVGGGGIDQVMGFGGDDTLLLGDGNDNVFFNAGDGNDIVEGGAGQDHVRVRGREADEAAELLPVGQRVRLALGPERADLNDVETTTVHPLRGSDVLTVRDLSGTDLKEVVAELESSVGSGIGDDRDDRVLVDGTNGNDVIALTGVPDFVTVGGLSAIIRIRHAEFSRDRLTIDSRNGADSFSATGLAPGSIQFTVF